MSKTKKESLATVLLRPLNPALIIILGVYTIVWGLWVANPFWEVFSSAELYGALSHIAPEWFWGCLAITAGTVTVYGAVKRHYGPLTRGAQIAGWHWLMISIFYFIGDPLNTGGITALFLAFYGAVVYLNIRVNYKNVTDKHDLPL
jgi:hypothetical protein